MLQTNILSYRFLFLYFYNIQAFPTSQVHQKIKAVVQNLNIELFIAFDKH